MCCNVTIVIHEYSSSLHGMYPCSSSFVKALSTLSILLSCVRPACHVHRLGHVRVGSGAGRLRQRIRRQVIHMLFTGQLLEADMCRPRSLFRIMPDTHPHEEAAKVLLAASTSEVQDCVQLTPRWWMEDPATGRQQKQHNDRYVYILMVDRRTRGRAARPC